MSAGFWEKFRPDIYVDSLMDIDLVDLKDRGYDALLVDMDNTLLPWKGINIPESTREWINKAAELGFRICIVSNTHNPRRLEIVGEQLGVQTVFQAIKPRRRGFCSAIEMLGSSPQRSVVIGDQMLTDIWGGKRTGVLTILVEPINSHEFLGTRLSRLVEKAIRAALRRRPREGTDDNYR